MKRILTILLAMAMLLAVCCACGEQDTADTTPEPTTNAAQLGIYVEGSQLEQESGGVLKLYKPTRNDYYKMDAIDDKLVLLAGSGKTTVELYVGQELALSADAQLPVMLQQGYQCLYNGFAYYDAANHQAVFLDPVLQETMRLDMPADMQGQPAFAPDGSEIFYCVQDQIRGLDTQRGVSRLIKSHGCASQTLLGVYFDGAMILCETLNESGEQSFLYISTQDGGTHSEDAGIEQLDTYENRFCAVRMDGTTRQVIFGQRDTQLYQLNTQFDLLVPAACLGGAGALTWEDDGSWRLSYYDFDSGKCSVSVAVAQMGDLVDAYADRWNKCIWLLMDDGQSQNLLRWDIAPNSQEETVYTGPLFTAEAPDEAGLDLIQDRVDQMNKTYGVNIRIWQKAIKVNGGHDLEGEHQTGAIALCLDQLEAVLAKFPENFLYRSVNDRIRICIVRTVDGQVAAAQYWDDGDSYVVLSVGVDVENALLRAIGYVVDSHILGNSPMLDTWEGLNPEGFVYSEEAPANVDYLAYLEGEDRAFVDAPSMGSVSDDRARIFWQAMQPGNEEMFASQTMQAKLLLLCRSIRDAWRLEKKTETYPWEQYLNESIAYVK